MKHRYAFRSGCLASVNAAPRATILALCVAILFLPSLARSQVNVLQYHYDASCDGQNLSESILTPTNVASAANHFGKLFTLSVDGVVYAQPLYMSGVSIPGQGVHNVVFVCTEHDSVYCFDADTVATASPAYLWHVNFLTGPSGTTVTTMSQADALNCSQIIPEIGITGTPVIDPATGTLYVASVTKEVTGANTAFVHRLHALSIYTGAEQPNSPVIMTASGPGTGDGGGKTTVTLNPQDYKTRPALALVNGVVYVGFASHCDTGTYHGWLLGYDKTKMTQTTLFITTPNGSEASLWGGGAAPATDGNGYLYIDTANGTFDANTAGGIDYGDTFLKLNTTGGLSVTDYFTPFNQATLSSKDLDTGSSGVLLLPPAAGSGAHQNLLTGAEKEGRIYLVDRGTMGKYQAGSDSQIVQSIVSGVNACFMTPAYFNNTVYYLGSGDYLKAFSINNALFNTTPVKSAAKFSGSGSTPCVSANSAATNVPATGIVWAIDTGGSGILHALTATNVASELWNSNTDATRDAMGSAVKFSAPIVANGKVYAGTQSGLVVYGLLPITITGTITLEGSVNEAQPITFQFQNATGAAAEMTVTLSSTGAFTLTNAPAGEYTLKVKGARWLQTDVAITATAGNVTGVTATLLPGDLNGDNVVDISDFNILASEFGGSGVDLVADLNCDGVVDIADFNLMATYFGLSGDP